MAQVRWDVGAELGAMQRFTTGRDPGAGFPTPGPMGELHAHVAVVPMLRAGPYIAHDISPLASSAARQMTEAGLRAKLSPPLFSGRWRSWAFLGLGYARTYDPAYRVLGTVAGGILDLPLGLGLGYRVRGPWEIFGELGGRIGLAFTGSMYDKRSCGGAPAPSPAACEAPYEGKDSFAVSLSLGVSLEE